MVINNVTLVFYFYKNISYKNIQAEISEVLTERFKNKQEAENLKRTQIFV